MVSPHGLENKKDTNRCTDDLASHFIIWAASKEAAFAHGRFLRCNWDVDELASLSKKFENPVFLTSSVVEGV
jgi:hypothetical protein